MAKLINRAVALLLAMTTGASAEECYLAPAEGLQIYWNGRVPPRVDRPFNMTPASGFFVGHAGFPAIAASDYQGTIYVMQWANRCVALAGGRADDCPGSNLNANPPFSAAAPGKQGTFFSSVARADACTIAQLSNALMGENRDAVAATAAAAGLKIADRLEEARIGTVNLAGGPAGRGLLDVCVLPPMPPAIKDKATGVAIDYEVQDNRRAEQTTALLAQLTSLIHGLKGRGGKALEAVLWTNPSNWNPARNGFTPESAPAIAQSFDAITIIPTGKTTANLSEDLTQQMGFWRIEPSKAIALYDFAERFPMIPGLSEKPGKAGLLAKAVGETVRGLKIDRVAIWGVARLDKNAACSPSGHQKISCLTGGACNVP